MSQFYVLPPKSLLGEKLLSGLAPLFPGLRWSAGSQTELVDALTEVVAEQRDVIVIFREELPEGVETVRALTDGFGAESGDEIIEVRLGNDWAQTGIKRRYLGKAA